MPSIHPKIHLPLPTLGIRPDLDDFHVPPEALRDTSFNWMLDDGRVITRPGLTVFANDPGTERPLAIISYVDHNNTRRIVHATERHWWHYNVSTNQWDDISDAGLLWNAGTNFAQFKTFNSGGTTYLLGVNRLNTPRAWDSNPANDFALFGGSAPVAGTVGIVADRVLLGNLGVAGGGTQIDVSAFQNHAAGWGTVQTTTLVDTPGRIVSIMELGATVAAVYKTDAIYLASGTTGLAPIRFDLHSAYTPSPESLQSIVPLSQTLHAFFTFDGELYLFDGSTLTKHPASDYVRRLYQDDPPNGFAPGAGISHAYYNPLRNELRWFHLQTGGETTGSIDAISINMANGSVWKLSYFKSNIPFTASYFGIWQTTTQLRNRVFLGRNTGQIYLEGGDTDAGTAIDVRLDTGLSDLGDPTRYKSIEETEHFFSEPNSEQTPSIQLFSSKSGEGEVATEEQSLTLTPTSSGPYVVGHRRFDGSRLTARFIGIRIKDQDLTAPLEYRGTSVLAIPRGGK